MTVKVTPLSVLLVEDDLDGRRLCAEWLTGAGFQVQEAHNGLQALEPLAVTRHVQDVLPAGSARQFGQRQRVGALRQAGDRPAAGLARDDGQGVGKGFGKRCH